MLDDYYPLAGFPLTRRVLDRLTLEVVDAEDPDADQAEVALLRAEGSRGLIMLPLVANGEAVGIVELTFLDRPTDDVARIALARTMAHEGAMALENARLYETARNLADHDPLTGFYNHRFLHERLAEEVVRATRTRRQLSVIMLDLDDFKLVNDTFGHVFGDRVLRPRGRAHPLHAACLGRRRPLRRRRVRRDPARDPGRRGGRRGRANSRHPGPAAVLRRRRGARSRSARRSASPPIRTTPVRQRS